MSAPADSAGGIADDRECAECGSDILGNDPHAPWCSQSDVESGVTTRAERPVIMTPRKKGQKRPPGRPALPEGQHRVARNLSLAPATEAWLVKSADAEEVSPGVVVDRLVIAEQKREQRPKKPAR